MALERYTPENPNALTLEDLAAYVERELQRVSNAFVQAEEEADELHVPPARPQNGGRYLADGTDWNPGEGRGWYWYDSVLEAFFPLGHHSGEQTGRASLSILGGLTGIPSFNAVPGDLIERKILTSAATSIEFTGLDIVVDRSYRLEVDFVNDTGGSSLLSVYLAPNSGTVDTTDTNYYKTGFVISAGVSTPFTTNDSFVGNILANEAGRISATFNVSYDGTDYRPVIHSTITRNTGSNVEFQDQTITKTVDIDNITKIRLVTAVANVFAAGTQARLYYN